MKRNFVTRKFEFDAGHRVMNERIKCYNPHGHRYVVEMTFAYREMEDLGYAIDFKEIKRVGCAWIDDAWDHAFIANPKDEIMIDACRKLKSKLYIMKLAGIDKYCNPSAENMAKELYFAMSILVNKGENLTLENIRLYETPNCWVDCSGLKPEEIMVFHQQKFDHDLLNYKEMKGEMEYDDRKI